MAQYKIRSETEDTATLIELGGDGTEHVVHQSIGGDIFKELLEDGVVELDEESLSFWKGLIEFEGGSGDSEEE